MLEAPTHEYGAEPLGEFYVNLRSVRPAANNQAKSGSDPKEPHIFQEAVAGTGVCAVCSRGKSDPRHPAVEENESPRWGF